MRHLKSAILATSAILLSTLNLQSQAHHSSTGYDLDSRIEITGTVKSAMFRNPHGTLVLEGVAPVEGFSDATEWEVETAASNLLRRRGWDFKRVKPGLHVTLTGHARKDKAPVLYLREIKFDDGTVFGDPDGQDKSLD